MNPEFKRLMQDAVRLTRSGDLAAATAAIRSALSRGNSSSPPDGDIIDVQARDVADTASPMLDAPHVEAFAQAAPRAETFAQPEPAPRAPVPVSRDEAFIAGRFGTGPAARDYKLYIPPGVAGEALPLVVMLHGCTQNPDDFAAGTAMNEAAREEGCFVLYPAQSPQANPQRCWNWFKHTHQARGHGEPATLAAMTLDVMARYAIDPARVYVAGLSAGGAMAAILGQAYPDLFAAIGVHSGLPHDAARDLPSALQAMKAGNTKAPGASSSTPTIVFHGDADATVHPVNGETLFASAGLEGAGVRTESGRAPGGHAWTRRVKAAPDGTPLAEHWQVHGAAHAWSGGSAQGTYTDPKGPDATKEMLRFFRSHALRRA